MKIEIVAATEKDFDAIYNFVNELEDTVFDRKRQHEIFVSNLQNPNTIYLMAFDKKEPVGFISLHVQNLLHHSGLIGEIQEMFVTREYRNKGVGKLLIAALIERTKSASQQGEEKKIIQLEVTSSKVRQQAHAFYIREGFAETHLKFTYPL